jgi:hypothetical protein
VSVLASCCLCRAARKIEAAEQVSPRYDSREVEALELGAAHPRADRSDRTSTWTRSRLSDISHSPIEVSIAPAKMPESRFPRTR